MDNLILYENCSNEKNDLDFSLTKSVFLSPTKMSQFTSIKKIRKWKSFIVLISPSNKYSFKKIKMTAKTKKLEHKK